MKHSSECVNFWTDELAAVCTMAGIALPQSVTDLLAHWPPNPPGVPTAQQRAVAKLTRALKDRADTRTDYAWAFSKTPPTWTDGPMQIGGGVPISQSSQQPGVVIPPAPGGGTPNPAPPAAGPAQPWMEAKE